MTNDSILMARDWAMGGKFSGLKLTRAYQAASVLIDHYSDLFPPSLQGQLCRIQATHLLDTAGVHFPRAELAMCDELAALIAPKVSSHLEAQDPVLVTLMLVLAYSAAILRDGLASGSINSMLNHPHPESLVGLPTEVETRANMHLRGAANILIEAQCEAVVAENRAAALSEVFNVSEFILRGRMFEQLYKWNCFPLAAALLDEEHESWILEQGSRFLNHGDSLNLEVMGLMNPREIPLNIRGVLFSNDGQGFRRPAVVLTTGDFELLEAQPAHFQKLISDIGQYGLEAYLEPTADTLFSHSIHLPGSAEMQINHLARVFYQDDLNVVPVLILDSAAEVEEVMATLVKKFLRKRGGPR
ncbi:TonB-dependent receptor [Novimethylophilus kurashikiensis]|uniref:TonB-dependent receptor n=1 Tax=Novimethylophilus kurashikiensis TaxID=1825523 RepID=A0A2R5F999_9PROT|nr:hypothetical protein [Novimethylophilus kurashikiensis]GBG14810.1 TonB-dependent receptor [Novimethylophilus kurashikiensis]